MIFDSIENYKFYTNINPKFQIAFDFLLSQTSLEEGAYVLDGDKVIAHAMTRDTKLEGTALLEYHKKYIDIQYVVQGEEICGLSPIGNLKHLEAYNEENDIGFLDLNKDESMIKVKEGDFYIVWPHEGHRPLGAVDNRVDIVKKIVVKVAVD